MLYGHVCIFVLFSPFVIRTFTGSFLTPWYLNLVLLLHLLNCISLLFLIFFNTSTASPRHIRGCCLILERRYGFRAGA